MIEIKKDGYIFRKSTRKNKKYDVFKKEGDKLKKKASFGGLGYQHFKDRIGLYKTDDHNDKKRKELYYKRHGKEAKFESPKWFSHKYLW